jgi:hypothetical protein
MAFRASVTTIQLQRSDIKPNVKRKITDAAETISHFISCFTSRSILKPG